MLHNRCRSYFIQFRRASDVAGLLPGAGKRSLGLCRAGKYSCRETESYRRVAAKPQRSPAAPSAATWLPPRVRLRTVGATIIFNGGAPVAVHGRSVLCDRFAHCQ